MIAVSIRSIGTALVVFLLSANTSTAQSSITATQLQKAVSDSLPMFERYGIVVQRPAVLLYCNRTYRFVRPQVDFRARVRDDDFHATPDTWLFQEQLELELYKRYLFRQPQNKDFAQPYFDRAQALIDGHIATVASLKTPWREFIRSGEFFETAYKQTMDSIFDECVDAWAKANNYRPPTGAAPAPTQGEILVLVQVSSGRTVRVVQFTTHLVLETLGRSKENYPWVAISDGETLPLLGTYYFQVARGKNVDYIIKPIYLGTRRLSF